MQRNFHPRALILGDIHKVRINAPQHGLMRHNHDIFTPLHLHNNRFQPNHHITIRLSSLVTVVVFIVVTSAEIFRIGFLNFFVGETVANSGVKFVESFPLLFGVGEVVRGLDRTFHGRGPERDVGVTDGFTDEAGEVVGVLVAAGREVGVTADAAGYVEFRFTMLENVRQTGAKCKRGTYPGKPD